MWNWRMVQIPHWMWGAMVIRFLAGLVLFGLVVYLLVKLTRGNASRTPITGERKQTDRALEILNERYSKGEIDDEEYQRRKQTLLSP